MLLGDAPLVSNTSLKLLGKGRLQGGALWRKITRKKVMSTIQADPSMVMVFNPAFIEYVHGVWLKKNGKYPSTGFMTVALALHICDQVRIFGFGANRKGYWDHYFEKTKASLSHMNHGGRFEYATIMELHKRKKVEMYRGW